MKFVCEKCGKQFVDSSDCEKHELEHMEEEKKREEFNVRRLESKKNINKLYGAYQEAVSKHVNEFQEYVFPNSKEKEYNFLENLFFGGKW